VAELDLVLEEGQRITIYDVEVKWPIGSLREDYVGIGKERHRKEVVPFIKQVMAQERARAGSHKGKP